jgi:hypothetical protein
MQMKFDFSGKLNLDGKKTEPIITRVPADFKTIFQIILKKRKLDESSLARLYLIEGVKKDLGELFILESNLSKSLGEILSKHT